MAASHGLITIGLSIHPARYASFLDSSAGWVSGGESPAIWDTNRTRGAIAKTTDG